MRRGVRFHPWENWGNSRSNSYLCSMVEMRIIRTEEQVRFPCSPFAIEKMGREERCHGQSPTESDKIEIGAPGCLAQEIWVCASMCLSPLCLVTPSGRGFYELHGSCLLSCWCNMRGGGRAHRSARAHPCLSHLGCTWRFVTAWEDTGSCSNAGNGERML